MNASQFPVFVALVAVLVTPARAADRTPDVWARSVHHEDGGRTDSLRDTNAQVIEAKTYDKSGKMVMKRVLQTDSKGRPRKGFIFDASEKPIYKLGFEYDEIDRLAETSLFNVKGDIITKMEHQYDSEGRETAPKVKNFGAQLPTKAGEIRPAAAMAAPGSTEQVIAGPAAVEIPDPPEKEKRGIFKFFKKKKK